jgi:alpha-glucoside transport system substrate-binding protein
MRDRTGAGRRSVRTRARHRLLGAIVAVSAVALVLAGCARQPAGSRALRGQTVEVMSVWTGVEQQRFRAVLDAFAAATGVSVTSTSSGDGDLASILDARLTSGAPPDVALLPQPALLRDFAARGVLVPLGPIVGDVVARNYAPVWTRLATVGGQLYGVWFKAADKSLVWYDLARFEQAGLIPPDDLDGLERVARTLAASGTAAFSVGAADGWTLTDWFENLYLARWGPERYDELADHRISWTDPTVQETLTWFTRLLAPELVAGGPGAALTTDFEASVAKAFGTRPGAAMVMEGDFVAGAISPGPGATLGVDVDVFPFPSGGGEPAVMGGGDVAVLLRSSPASRALVRFLATPEAAAIWARQGGFLSANLNLDLATYPDDLTRSMARAVIEAGDSFRFDLSDLQPVAFGSTEGQGLPGALQQLLVSGDVAATAARLEQAATAAFGR